MVILSGCEEKKALSWTKEGRVRRGKNKRKGAREEGAGKRKKVGIFCLLWEKSRGRVWCVGTILKRIRCWGTIGTENFMELMRAAEVPFEKTF